MTAPYAVRKIDITFQLGTGNFGNTGANQLKLTGLRVSVQIENARIPTPMGIATTRIYGMTLDHINQLTVAGLTLSNFRHNLILIEAGDDVSGMTAIYKGNIMEAYPDFNSMPDTSFVVIANPGAAIQMTKVKPLSYPGTVSSSTVLNTLAQNAGLKLENNGVNTQLASPYFPGSAWSQILRCLNASNVYGNLDTVTGTLSIWPKDSSRSTGGNPVISSETGMIGYPEFQHAQIVVKTLFNPKIQAGGAGQKMIVQSQLKSANGTWVMSKINYNLESQNPNGSWEMVITGTNISLSQGGG